MSAPVAVPPPLPSSATGAGGSAASFTAAGVAVDAAPNFGQTLSNWTANLSNAIALYEAQIRMDRDQQGTAFASAVEAKGHQMAISTIQNIR